MQNLKRMTSHASMLRDGFTTFDMPRLSQDLMLSCRVHKLMPTNHDQPTHISGEGGVNFIQNLETADARRFLRRSSIATRIFRLGLVNDGKRLVVSNVGNLDI